MCVRITTRRYLRPMAFLGRSYSSGRKYPPRDGVAFGYCCALFLDVRYGAFGGGSIDQSRRKGGPNARDPLVNG